MWSKTTGASPNFMPSPTTFRKTELPLLLLLLLLIVESGEPGGQTLHRSLELGVKINERPQLIGEPGESDLVIAPPSLELLDTAISEVHERFLREGLLHESALLLQMNTR